MNCYFGAYELPAGKPNAQPAVVTFHIPDVGIKFKAPFEGVNVDHCDFASLLALLEFIDTNQKYFSNQAYQIFGNNKVVIDQVNERLRPPDSFTPLIERAKKYREKYRFSLEWVPSSENSAYDPLLD